MVLTRMTHLFFDLGNVLVNVHMDALYKNFSAISGIPTDTIPQLLSRITREYLLFQCGLIDKRCYFDRIQVHFEKPLSDREIEEAYCHIFTLHEPVLQIVDELDGQYHFSIISNTDELHYNYLLNEYSDLKKFRNNTTSFREKCLKPEKYIYRQALSKNRALPQHSLLIDDLEENIKSARDLGFHASQFTNSADLRSELTKLGIIV